MLRYTVVVILVCMVRWSYCLDLYAPPLTRAEEIAKFGPLPDGIPYEYKRFVFEKIAKTESDMVATAKAMNWALEQLIYRERLRHIIDVRQTELLANEIVKLGNITEKAALKWEDPCEYLILCTPEHYNPTYKCNAEEVGRIPSPHAHFNATSIEPEPGRQLLSFPLWHKPILDSRRKETTDPHFEYALNPHAETFDWHWDVKD